MNPILVDSYKNSHYKQLPAGTTEIQAYIEARGTDRTIPTEKVVFFGLQALIETYLTTPITMVDVDRANKLLIAHMGMFPYDAWKRVVELHGGYIPVEISALPEGSVVPFGTPLVTVRSTDPELAWMASYIETFLLRGIWYPTTVATKSWAIKQIIRKQLLKTSDNLDSELPFKLHDFGARGASSGESAAIGGAAHLVNFMGTDTMEALTFVQDFYADEDYVAGYSVPASEHSTTTVWGREGEEAAYRNMFAQFGKPGGIVSAVSDSYDYFKAVCHFWCDKLRKMVQESSATLVIRPDSGDPVECVMYALTHAADAYGYTINSKGFRVVNQVRVLQGDGINIQTIHDIYAAMEAAGFAADNVVFGMGGSLLQGVTRDTFKFAQKACLANTKDRGWVTVAKNPITDPGKRSKAGFLAVTLENDIYVTTVASSLTAVDKMAEIFDRNLLKTQYYNGTVGPRVHFDEIRKRANDAY